MLWKSSGPQFNKIVKIGNKLVGEGQSCFVIAEAGSNHNQKFALAKKLVDIAAKAKADAVKFQLFVPEKIYVRNAGFADYLGKERTIQQIFHDIMMPQEWMPKLAEYCKKKGIMFLSSAFDEESVDLVDSYVLAHKIASYEITHLPLIRHIAKKGKPIIMSVAMASISEIRDALRVIASTGNRNVVLMHCIAKYPAPIEATNLRVIDALRKEFGIPVGLSDHSREPLINPVAAVARGADMIEKHFTVSNKLPGPDHKHAIEPDELKEMVASIRKTESALGSSVKKVQQIERELYTFARRRIHAIKDIKKGEIFTKQNIAVLRSGKARLGLEPKYFDWILGRRAVNDINESDGVRKEDVA
ncbi:MAG: N-acetylneuraminate synthase family protein [Candidatus Woesearchaeota archaeon]